MPSQPIQSKPGKPENAEERFRKAFERLKSGNPTVLKPGILITQNNIAREAGCDPSALKKARFPAFIREIQAYIELHSGEEDSANQKTKQKRAKNRSIQERCANAERQRDKVQSILASANMRILELSEEIRSLQRQLDEIRPPPKISCLI